MDLTKREIGRLRIVDVGEARIDAAVAIAFKDGMRALVEDAAGDVVLNLEHVTFIDSSGLGAIVAAKKMLGEGRRLHLSGMQPPVDKVFRLTRMDSVFVIHPALDAAVADHAG